MEKYYVKFSIGGPLFIFSYNEITAENFTLHKQHIVKMGKVITVDAAYQAHPHIKPKFFRPRILPFDCVSRKLSLYAQKPV